VGKIIVEIMPKKEILDPQGKAIVGALKRLGIDGFTDARQGKRFTLTTEGPVTEAELNKAAQAAEKLLSNPIIEDVVAIKAADEKE
jgi:phosphoribosylformylglycinamidine synthase